MVYIGIDLHKRFSQITVMNKQGRIKEQTKLYHELIEKYRHNFWIVLAR